MFQKQHARAENIHSEAAEEEKEEHPFTPDDPANVREQNLRALLVLLPAKVMDSVVKEAMEGAALYIRRKVTSEAERQRKSLASNRAEFRHTRKKEPKVRSSAPVPPSIPRRLQEFFHVNSTTIQRGTIM